MLTNKIVYMQSSPTPKPTESELSILNILWEKEQASVREVHEALSEHKISGYTTTLKLMQIMFEKGIVSRDASSKVHIYRPNLTKENTQQQLVGKLITNLFGGSSSQLVLQALGNHQPNSAELAEIEALIAQLKKNM